MAFQPEHELAQRAVVCFFICLSRIYPSFYTTSLRNLPFVALRLHPTEWVRETDHGNWSRPHPVDGDTGDMAQALEPLPAWDAPFGSELQGRLPQPRDSFVNALLCFCSGLASNERILYRCGCCGAETTTFGLQPDTIIVPKSLLLALYCRLFLAEPPPYGSFSLPEVHESDQ
jgi:hypothetical protein